MVFSETWMGKETEFRTDRKVKVMTKSTIKKLVWAQILFFLLSVPLYVIAPSQTDYSELEDRLYSGFLSALGDTVLYSAFVLFLALTVVSWVLLLTFHKAGPLFYTLAMVFGTFVIMFMGDEISYGLLYPLDWIGSALEGIILYLVLFTPLKTEFGKPKVTTQSS